jgi:enoyl-CoA hydratase
MEEPKDIIYQVEDGRARIILNRPEKLNALNQRIQREIHDALWEADNDTSVHCVIIKGAGRSFCSGYDLTGGGSLGQDRDPGKTYRGARSFDDDTWQLERNQRFLMPLFDMHKPSIAQVHGHCLAGGSELATGCDLVYMAEDAQMGYPAVRFGVPDMQFHAWLVGMRRGMEMVLTGDSINGIEAAELGWATRAYPADRLEAETLEQASRIASLPPDIVALNKRAVHRQMEVMGMRQGLRQGTELCSLAIHQESFKAFIDQTGAGAGRLTDALQKRDEGFGDYRTAKGRSGEDV